MIVQRYQVDIGGIPSIFETVLCRKHTANRRLGQAQGHPFHGLCHACDDEYAAEQRDMCERASLYRVAPFED